MQDCEEDMAFWREKPIGYQDDLQSPSIATGRPPATIEDDKAQRAGGSGSNSGINGRQYEKPLEEPEDGVVEGRVPFSWAEEGAFVQRDTEDLEAVHPVSSGPVYSVFNHRQRQYIVFMVACAGFFSPLSANIYFPALNSLSRDLNVSSEMINLSITTYMIFQGLAPTVFGDLADMTGRRPTYMIGFIIYIGANVGLALQNNYAALLVLRCLQSTGSSGTIALGSGVVADIASSGERGNFMGTHLLPICPHEITDPVQESLNLEQWQLRQLHL